MKCKKNFLILGALSALIILLPGIGTTAFGAGGGGLDQGNNLGGSIDLGNNSYYSSAAYNGEDSGSASFWLRLDPNKVSFSNANWYFYVDYNDPTYWTANCFLYGQRDDNERWPQNQTWYQSINRGDVSISESLSFSCQKYSWADTPEMNLGGTFNISLAQITNTSFRYWEGEDTQYTWPNGYDHDPILTEVPAWYGQFQINGNFVADTPEAARALGAQFSSVPEPSAICMLTLAAIASVMVWRLPAQAGKKR